MQHFNKRIILLFSLIFWALSVQAQTGTIRGQIIDDETGEALIGATAVIVGTQTGAPTDLDGKFEIAGLAPGAYSLQVSYVSYVSQKIENVEVTPGGNTVLNIRLKPESMGLEEIVVEAKQIRDNEAALLTLQKKSNLVLDGIPASLFQKTGDSDAAAAIRRVTGVSVEGGKYVYVRGLGDRYSKTALNNAEIPGLDPNKNTVQMDLFPANLIDNLIVYKTFSPELPGSFSGGFVNIVTKDFPDQFTLQVSGSLGYNVNASFNNEVINHELGSTHFLAFAPESRNRPAILAGGVPGFTVANDAERLQLDRVSRSFNHTYTPEASTPFMNHSFSFSIGDQKKLFGKPLGFIGGVSYSRNYEYYDNGRTERYVLLGDVAGTEALTPLYLFNDERGAESVLWGGLLNLSYKISSSNKVSLNFTYNRSGESVTRFQEGIFPFDAGGINENRRIETRSFFYTERSLSSLQLLGEHKLSANKNIKLDWLVSGTRSTQDEPNLRFFNNLLEILPDGTIFYDLFSNNVDRPAQYWREMEETNLDTKVNLEIPIGSNADNKIRMGGPFYVKTVIFWKKPMILGPGFSH
ncbi:MAG: TonB-dependent receptor plug domain-containing protein [Microscillaceae bacterium]|nr:TonB-dependent receptor plug domain-containing protein [Microscillaceae bacterium]